MLLRRRTQILQLMKGAAFELPRGASEKMFFRIERYPPVNCNEENHVLDTRMTLMLRMTGIS